MDKLSGLKDSDSGYDHPITHGVYSLHHTFQDMTVGTLCRSPHDPDKMWTRIPLDISHNLTVISLKKEGVMAFLFNFAQLLTTLS